MSLPLIEERRIQAAEGWLELGNPHEARSELDGIAPPYLGHPMVLSMRCRMLEASSAWPELLDLSRKISETEPSHLTAWLSQGRALHELGKTHLAYHLLVDVVELFPGNQTIRYHIACYAAQRGLLEEAIAWLKIVFETDGDYFYRNQALRDRLLLPLWRSDEITSSLRALF